MNAYNTYAICNTCAPAIINADFSGLDQDVDYPRVVAFLERVGYIARTTENDCGGYWDCDACEQTQIGSGHLFESLADHVHEQAERAAAMQRHPATVSKQLAAAKDADQYAEHLDDTMPSADEIADMHDWADTAISYSLTGKSW